MSGEPASPLTPSERQRGIESVVLARLIEQSGDGLTEAQIVEGMDSDTPERAAAVRSAIAGLIEVRLLTRVDDVLRPTPAARRAGELELGL